MQCTDAIIISATLNYPWLDTCPRHNPGKDGEIMGLANDRVEISIKIVVCAITVSLTSYRTLVAVIVLTTFRENKTKC